MNRIIKNPILFTLISITVALVWLIIIDGVHGQITDSKYFPCIERVGNNIFKDNNEVVHTNEVKLFIDHSKSNFTNDKSNPTNICTSELFNEGIQYYKSQGYNETDYTSFNVPPTNIQSITLTKEEKRYTIN